MQLSIGRIILLSPNKDRLASFLSDLFDLEYAIIEDGVLLSNIKMRILVREGKYKKGSDIVDFYVKNTNELEEHLNRVKFAYYRINEDLNFNIDGVTIKRDTDGSQYFDFQDTDGRSWRFTSME